MITYEIAALVVGFATSFLIGYTIIKLRRRRHRNKIEPKAPWDGVHRLEHLKYFEWYPSPDDFHTGWIWKCACGIGNSHLYWRLPYTEEAAMAEFKKHLQIHKGECNCFGN
jgi:hypothetical protein